MVAEGVNRPRTKKKDCLFWKQFALGLFLIFGIISFTFASPKLSDTLAPQERKHVFAEGIKELDGANLRIKNFPDSLGPHWDRLRILYVLGVKEEKYLDQAFGELELLKNKVEATNSNLLLGYTGALTVVRAKHGLNLKRKWANLKQGLPMLDTAVAQDINQAELRYLRITCNYYLPFFLGRKPLVKADFLVLGKLLPKIEESYPPKWFVNVGRFVLEKGKLPDSEKLILEKRIKLAAVKLGQT